jgi:hypothetical protein
MKEKSRPDFSKATLFQFFRVDSVIIKHLIFVHLVFYTLMVSYRCAFRKRLTMDDNDYRAISLNI